MRVGIVGSGVSGLAAARALTKTGASVTVFEQEAHVGGRCLTVRVGDYVFDPGASSLVPRNLPIAHVILKELDTTGLVEISRPVYTHDGRRVFLGAGVPPTPRYCYEQGIQRLCELLADGIEVRLKSKVTNVQDMRIGDERFDRIVLAVPTPVAEMLLAPIDPHRKATNTKYRPCVSVLLGFDRPTNREYHAVVAEESAHPMHWLSIESLKTPGRAPEGHSALVVQMGPKYSKYNMDAPAESIVSDALVDVTRILGGGYERPKAAKVVRFLYSQPDSVSGFDSINYPHATIVVASDGLEGGRTEHAYDAGVKAAQFILRQ